MKYIFVLVAIILLFMATACSDKQDTVVVYTSVDQVFSEPVLKEFEKKTGIKVKVIYDTEETKSTGVLNRLIAEKNNPRCDVFWSGDPVRTNVLKHKGITEPYVSSVANDIPDVYKDPDHHWTGFSARARVLIYNKKMLAGDDVPSSVFDLLKEEYKNNVATANPLFGTTTFHIAALFLVLGNEKAEEFLTGLKDNGLVIAASNGDVKKRVMNGEVACGLTDTDDAFEAVKESSDVDYVFLDQDGMGTLIMPNTVCLIKDSPDSYNGKKLIDYLLSKDTEAKLAILCAQMPLYKGVKTMSNVPSLDNIKPMKIDYDKASQKLEEIQNYLKKWAEN
jgi:iron(III) transport system substrate-binding protein